MRKIVLASSSPRRKQLLTSLGLDFTVMPSNIDEKLNPRLGPRSQTEQLSRQKAEAVVGKASKDAVIIAADSLIFLGKEIIGKPETKEHARRILTKLQGRMHTAITGFTVVDTKTMKGFTDSVITKVWMRKLTAKEIDSYIEKENVLDKAGSYAMQNLGSLLFEKIEGDYFNVVGLPLSKLFLVLKKFGIVLL